MVILPKVVGYIAAAPKSRSGFSSPISVNTILVLDFDSV